MQITTWRVYDHPFPDGYRVLAERLWPRGICKADLALDAWPKELTLSPALRQWFHHDPELWAEFQARYLTELRQQEKAVRELLQDAGNRDLVLLYSAHDAEHNAALVLRKYLLTLTNDDDGGAHRENEHGCG